MSLRKILNVVLALSLLAVTASTTSLAPRDTPCADGMNLSSCPSSIPFCCPSDSTCMVPPAANSTVICCPTGQDCSVIHTIVCDTSLQNAAWYPESPIHSNFLDVALPTCGKQCCPLGYLCANGDECVMVKQAPPKSTSTLSSTSASASSVLSTKSSSTSSTTSSASGSKTAVSPTSGSVAATSSTGTSTSTATAAASMAPSSPSGGAIAGIVIGVLAALALVVLAVILLLRRRKQKESHQSPSPTSSSFMSRTPRLGFRPVVPDRTPSMNRNPLPTPPTRSDFLLSPSNRQTTPIVRHGPAGVGSRMYSPPAPQTPERPLLAPSTVRNTPHTPDTRRPTPRLGSPFNPVFLSSILPDDMERVVPPDRDRRPLFVNPLRLPTSAPALPKPLPSIPGEALSRAPGVVPKRPMRGDEPGFEAQFRDIRSGEFAEGRSGDHGNSDGTIEVYMEPEMQEVGRRNPRETRFSNLMRGLR